MNKRALFFIFVSVLAGLNVASIRKAEDPIRDTQTNPILYKQKMEEEKDGKKGPLLYSVKNNPHDTFFIDPPYEAEKETSTGKAVTQESTAPEETAEWWEEQPGESRAVSSDGTLAEVPVKDETLQGGEAGDPLTSIPDTGDVSKNTKEDDYWW